MAINWRKNKCLECVIEEEVKREMSGMERGRDVQPLTEFPRLFESPTPTSGLQDGMAAKAPK